ncbi:mushroom body large-type Kenyon cell-specific protein 1 [Elysia marginata]|uniref:Mushroom body large-type Kenyon cell-specific protein 1 n=1 Tax=Elysia marginata TaxID=1093978 RepID=A0AAV4JT42_9GAST|nr:mushroom body large-type Kenyon cell-specific protein 1 [Elysia marginata]
MVDCGSPRCAQFRRSFRRDLQFWGKKLPLVLGLERIAADYVDKETSELLLNPYPEWENCMTCDFEPAKKCFHCDKKLPNIYRRIQRIIDEAKRGKVSNGKICFRSLQDLMPFCLDFYKHGFGHELFSDFVKDYFINASTVPAEPLQLHAHNHPTEVQQQVQPFPITEVDSSPQQQPQPCVARPGASTDGSLISHPSTTPASSSSVLVPGDNSLNRLRVPIVSSNRAHRKNERQQKDFIKHETFSTKNEGVSKLKRPWQNNSSNKSSNPCSSTHNHWDSQDSHRFHPYHSPNHNKSPFAVRYEDYSAHQKRLRSHQRHSAVEVIISDSEEEEANLYPHRPSDQPCGRQLKDYHQQLVHREQRQREKEGNMSALDLFDSAHRRLRLEHLEQLGHLGQLEHDQQHHLEGMRTAASASLFRLANQHLLPPGVDPSAFSVAAAAAASVTPAASAALPFLLPILPCSLKLKLEPGEEERVPRRDEEDFPRKDNLCENRFADRGDHILQQRFPNKTQGISNFDLRTNGHDSYEILQQQYRLENLRRMHNLNGVVRHGECQADNFKDQNKSLPTRCVGPSQTGNVQHDFYQKELKLPLLTNLVRKLVHQKFEEITQRSRQGSQNETSVEESPDDHQTHRQRMSLENRKEESFTPYNPFLTPLPTHFLTAALASNDENIATPMYNYIMESIYTNMMKEDSSPAPNSFGSVSESGRVGEALKDIITKGVSQKLQHTGSKLAEKEILCPAPSKSLKSGYPVTPPKKPVIWSPAFSAVSSDVETKEKSCSTSNTVAEEKEVVSPPAKRPKKESSSRNKSDGERRSAAASSSTALSSSDGSANNSSGKKTRPKRGQYRKYNSQLLMDAVKAVQRGEMSVHRAGSFYGVPHSTLEYKVKERHLLRQRKPREAGESSDSKTASEASSPPLPSSSTPLRLSLKAPSKERRTLRTQSQDSCSSIDGESCVSENTAGPPNSNKRKYKKANPTADSSSPRSSVSSSTPPSPGLPPLSPALAPAPVLNPPVSCITSTSPISSPPPPPSPLPAPASPHAAADSDKPLTGNNLNSGLAWFQPYLDVAPSMQQMIGSAATKASPSTLDSLGHTNSASELLRKLQHKVQAKESGLDSSLSRTFSPSADSGGGTVELSCGQDRRAYDLYRQPHHQASPGTSGPLQDRLMLYKQSA